MIGDISNYYDLQLDAAGIEREYGLKNQLFEVYDFHRSALIETPIPDFFRSKYFDRKGRRISSPLWSILGSSLTNYKVVAQDRIRNLFISTVWTGLDIFSEEKSGLIFETVVFEATDEDDCGDILNSARYLTEKDALEGHQYFIGLYDDMNRNASQQNQR